MGNYFGNTKIPELAAPVLTLPGIWLINWPGTGVITPGSLVAPPGVVLPDDYYFFNSPGAGHFPYGLSVGPDR